jgi:hypothetical protein
MDSSEAAAVGCRIICQTAAWKMDLMAAATVAAAVAAAAAASIYAISCTVLTKLPTVRRLSCCMGGTTAHSSGQWSEC